MKKYHIAMPYSDDPSCISIYNDDENPIIEKIECSYFNDEDGLEWSCTVDINNETSDIRKKFHAVPDAHKYLQIGVEMLTNQRSMDNIIQFIRIIQEIDPLPLSAFSEITEMITFDLSVFIAHGQIEEMVKQYNHVKALQLALDSDAQGDDEAMQRLANIYQKKKDKNNYFNVLARFPNSHKDFAIVNKLLFDNLISNPVSEDPEKKINRLELLLRYSLNAGMQYEASNFFDELCGNNGLNIQIKDVKGDPDTLIRIAQVQREIKRELDELRSYKAKIEAAEATDNRATSAAAAESRPSNTLWSKPYKTKESSNRNIGVKKDKAP